MNLRAPALDAVLMTLVAAGAAAAGSLPATPAIAQEPTSPAPAAAADTAPTFPIAAGGTHADSLPPGTTHAFILELPADRFVHGEVEQRTVDVRVTVRDPEGGQLARYNRNRNGTEVIHFDAPDAGVYRIEVEPVADSAAPAQPGGRYELRLRSVELIAEDPAARVDQLMIAYDGAVPGGVVAVVRGGEPVFARGYGLADLTHGVPFTADTRTNIGSTSKQFTAFAIGMLAQRGALSLDDDVRAHIPELPDFGDTVTLRHLLTHTSGYREFLNTLVLGGRRIDEGDAIDRDEIIRIVQRQPELQNEPGAEFNYNNTAFALLATVVERVTDTPFPRWMRENVFLPLGMERTLVRAAPTQIIENGARGYAPDPDHGYREVPDLGGAMGAGGIYTTVGDLARWIRNLETGALGGPDLIEAMTTRNVLTTGDTTDYGLGLFIDEYRGTRRIHHGGADLAHRSSMAYYPETGTGVLVLSNNAAFPGSVHSRTVDAFLADVLEPEEADGEDAVAAAAPFDPAAFDPAAFDAYAGTYELDEAPGFRIRFFREADTLYTQATGQPRLRVQPTSDSTFELVGVAAAVTFHRDDGGEVTHATLHQNGDHRATRLEGGLWNPTAAELEAFTGRYFSEELEAFYTIALEDERLVLRNRRFGDVPIAPEAVDAFTGRFPVAQVAFVRNEAGEVVALEASNGRARGIRFEREP